jgi:RHS repeat-associated protein
MTQVLNGTTVAMNYVHNGKGELVRKYLNTTNTYSLYDEAGQWLGDYNNSGVPTQQVIWLGDLPVGVLVGATTAQKLHYIEADALGTPRAVVDPTRGTQGTAIWTWNLNGEPFGTTAPSQNPDGDATSFVFNMRFPGQRFDSASGLNYNYFRDYQPAIGRYVQSDPIGLAGGVSTYGYVGGNSLTAADPMGLAVYRGAGSYYSDMRPDGQCAKAVFSGDYIVAWASCRQELPPLPGPFNVTATCPSPHEDQFDWLGLAWDLFGPDWTWLAPQAKVGKAAFVLATLHRGLNKFDRLGIQTTDHFNHRLIQRRSRGINEGNALDAYLNGRLYYNPAQRSYIRHSSRTGVSVVTDAPSGGKAITVFEGNPSPTWTPVPWRPGL